MYTLRSIYSIKFVFLKITLLKHGPIILNDQIITIIGTKLTDIDLIKKHFNSYTTYYNSLIC